ncbi:MAG: hypothetical protein H6601_02505 [Flavobacteriales bacterium]|nr:hypothetical protein [Flavobacteriales bacterium]
MASIHSNSVEELLKSLKQLQSQCNSTYPNGIFPSERYHPFLPYRRHDDNLFFTASIVHILQGILNEFEPAESELAESLISDAVSAYPLFRNKKGLDTYNFWQTTPSRHFPNGWFMHHFKHFQIPDDVDDTSLVYLTENSAKERVLWLREKLKQHANLAYKKAFNPLPKYRELKCYSTFFGKKMYIEFDLCVLSNLMRLILKHFTEQELNEYDRDTLEFIVATVENDEHKTLPFYSAPNYPTTELILYHLARLIPLLPESYRNRIKAKVRTDIQIGLEQAEGMNCILMENAAFKLGIGAKSNDLDSDTLLNDRGFFFFHAGMITAFENMFAQKLADNPFFHLRYASRALNGALLIENLVLKRSFTR